MNEEELRDVLFPEATEQDILWTISCVKTAYYYTKILKRWGKEVYIRMLIKHYGDLDKASDALSMILQAGGDALVLAPNNVCKRVLELFPNHRDMVNSIGEAWRCMIDAYYQAYPLPPFEKELTPKEQYLEYLQTDHWKQTRQAALERAGHRCQLCATTEHLQVHHNSYANLGNEKPEDLVVLCRKHHELFHDAQKKDKSA